MNFFKNDKTEKAVALMYTQLGKDDFQQAHALLTEAAAAGDGDAYYFLSRCYMGRQFFWEYAGFEEDEEKSMKYLLESIKRGSAIGTVGANRVAEMDEEVLKREMVFSSLKEAKDIVLEIAKAGEPFCQFLIGHVYYWGDILEIENLPHPFVDPAAYEALGPDKDKKIDEMEKKMYQSAVYWYEKAIDSGLMWGIDNLLKMYGEGEPGVPKNVERKVQLLEKLTAAGHPYYANQLGYFYYNQGHFEKALELYKRAASGGQVDANMSLALMYIEGKGVARDLMQAINYYKIAADLDEENAANNLGLLYLKEESVRDYEKAAYYFEKAIRLGDKYAMNNLAELYLKGNGVVQDYQRARELLEKGEDNVKRSRCLGQIYAYGLGVPEDISRGIAYLKQAGDDEEAKKHIANFKKGLFSGWKRRK